MKLTQRVIEALECEPGQKDMLTFDSVQRGLAVRTTAAGGKSYLVQYSAGGDKRRLPLGAVNAISLADARAAAQAVMGEVAKGNDPVAAKKEAETAAKAKAARAAFTFSTLVNDWDRLQLSTKSDRYRSEAVRALRVGFATFLNLPAANIDRQMVVTEVDKMNEERGAMMAARTVAYAKAAFQWAIKRGSLKENPFILLPVATTEKRERVLSDGELAEVWNAAKPDTLFGAIVRTLILTGQRREEVGAMQWGELSDDFTVWTIPAARAKNNAAHLVPLAPPVAELLRSRPRISDSDFVFTGRGRRVGGDEDGNGGEIVPGAFNAWSKCKERLDQAILEARKTALMEAGADADAAQPMPDWRIHDLRRTLATGMQRLGVRLEVTEGVLNHVSGSRGGIVGVYQRHNWADEKRAALDAWARHVAALVDGRQAGGNVVTMPAKGRKRA